jgi:hypothetical protein
MITFKEYISEMAFINKNIPKNMDWNVSKKDENWNLDHKKIGETDTHTIHRGTNIHDQTVYWAKNKKTKVNDLSIWGEEHEGHLSIDAMSKHEKSDGSMKMHHLIHHLIHKQGIKAIGSDEYSEGGKTVMDRVGEMSDTQLTYHKGRKQIEKPDNEYGDEVPKKKDKHTVKNHLKNTYVVARAK